MSDLNVPAVPGNAAALALVVGFVSATFVIPIFQQPGWSPRRRALFTFGYSIVVGTATDYVTGQLVRVDWWHLAGLVPVILLVLVTSISVYQGLAKKIGLAPAIEQATSPKTGGGKQP